jgi:hypothetical protein
MATQEKRITVEMLLEEVVPAAVKPPVPQPPPPVTPTVPPVAPKPIVTPPSLTPRERWDLKTLGHVATMGMLNEKGIAYLETLKRKLVPQTGLVK